MSDPSKPVGSFYIDHNGVRHPYVYNRGATDNCRDDAERAIVRGTVRDELERAKSNAPEPAAPPEWALEEAYPFAAYDYDDVAVHTEQIARALAAAYARGREEAAKVCDSVEAKTSAEAWDMHHSPDHRAAWKERSLGAAKCARAIRSGGA